MTKTWHEVNEAITHTLLHVQHTSSHYLKELNNSRKAGDAEAESLQNLICELEIICNSFVGVILSKAQHVTSTRKKKK